MPKKNTVVVDGEEVSLEPGVRGPGYDHPIAVAARARIESGKSGTDTWALDKLSQSPEERFSTKMKLH